MGKVEWGRWNAECGKSLWRRAGRGQMTENGSEDRGQKTDDRGQITDDRGQMTDNRGKNLERAFHFPVFVTCFLTSVF
jgi:hypothetical protein